MIRNEILFHNDLLERMGINHILQKVFKCTSLLTQLQIYGYGPCWLRYYIQRYQPQPNISQDKVVCHV